MRYLIRGEEKKYQKGTVIFQENLPVSNAICYLVEGLVSGSIEQDGNILYKENIKKDNLIGITSNFVNRKKHLETVIALTDVKLYVWDKEQFINVVGIYQELAKLVISNLSRQLRNLNKILAKKETNNRDS
ncbi:MAG: hypothetical protein DKM50_12985 [Candidatus Margulisiibacteriota bacterium]|nr:MAG: hypothetical protein A2X43_11215 [Candidatus Margulisbacteria bacterium GWD2_39_127]OGI02795.1 MAG: hypothetical protein A2X42_02040 [Candidatus Margulisbacteria bacterium GWF2_38_17]OGI09318.1 MAG: hypothetical protein A2X41_09335 [Candidatus Margulisbacteria bacterium GWE2_39_32]PZM77388.1 MAG: hypothetical protein DKM50_12985 [Candidatus Margulisiibacteriota bacterium]HAR63967.1 hypothetical protein [Candidatus Margulisiibacteriota bacterium]